MPNDDSAHQETQRPSRARLRVLARAEAVFAAFHDAIKAGRVVPMNHTLAEQFHCSEGAVSSSVRALIAAGRIRSIVKTGGTVGKYRSIEILNSSAASCASLAHEPNGVVQGSTYHACCAPPPNEGAIVRRENPDELPSAQPDGKARAAQPRNGSCQQTPPERVPGGIAPVVLSLTDGRSRNSSYSGMGSTPISIERIRQINAALPKAVALPASWGCQWIESPDGEWPPRYCAKPRQDNSSYCPTHHGVCHNGILRHHINLTPEERARRIEHGRKIKAAMARKRDIEARREQPQNGV